MKSSTKIAKEATISIIGMGFGDATRYLFTVLLARLVGVEYLGIYSLANSVTRVVEVFGKVALDGGVLRFVSMRQGTGDKQAIQKDIRSTLKMGLVFSFLAMAIQIALSGWLVYEVFHGSPLLRTVIIVNAITLPFSILTLIAAFATQGYKLLKYKVVVTNILAPVVLLITMVTAYFLFSQEMAIILPAAVSAIVGFLVIMKFLKNLTGVSFLQVFPAKFNAGILQYSYPIMFATAIGTIMHWIDIGMLGYFTDEKTVGLYHPATRTAGLLRTALVALMGIFAPMLSEFFAQNKLAEMSKLYKLVVRWVMTLTLPFAILLVMFSKKVMLLFGSDYLQASTVLTVLSFATLMQSFSGAGAPALNMTGHPKINLMNSSIAVIINIILNVWWIPEFGIMGAAWATFASLTVLGFLHSIRAWQVTKLQPLGWKLLKPFVAGLVTCVVLYVTKPYLMPYHTIVTLSLAVTITFLSYGLILWLLKFDEDDREVTRALLMIKDSSKRWQPPWGE